MVYSCHSTITNTIPRLEPNLVTLVQTDPLPFTDYLFMIRTGSKAQSLFLTQKLGQDFDRQDLAILNRGSQEGLEKLEVQRDHEKQPQRSACQR